MKTKMLLTAAIALVTAGPASAADYLQVDFYTRGTGTRTITQSNLNGIPTYQFAKIINSTFTVFVPLEGLFASDTVSVSYGNGFTISTYPTYVVTNGDSSGDSGIPDYRYGFDFAFRANFDNAPGNSYPLGYTGATGSGFLNVFGSSATGYGYRDEYSGDVTGLRVRQVDRAREGTTFVYSVPEPATWALMLVGFGMVGGATRYGRKRTTVAYA